MRRNTYTQIEIHKACHTLGLDLYTLTQEQLTQKHRELAAKYHPDHNKSNEAAELMTQVNNAKDILQQVLDFRNTTPVTTSYDVDFNNLSRDVEELTKHNKTKDAIKLIKQTKAIRNSFELAHILDFFKNADHRYTLVKHFKNRISNIDELISVATTLGEDKKFALIKERLDLLDQADDKKIKQLFAILTEKQQREFAKLMLKRQPNHLAIFIVVLEYIKPEDRLDLALQKMSLYLTCRNVLDVAHKLTAAGQKQIFISKIDSKKLDYDNMRDTIELVYLLPKNDQLSFLKDHITSIKSGDDLQQALATLKDLNAVEANRKVLPYIMQFLQFITSWDILSRILSYVDDMNNRETVFKACVDKPFFKEPKQHVIAVIEVLKSLSPTTVHQYLLNNKFALDWLDYLETLKLIPEDERYDYATDYIAVNKPVDAIIQHFADAVSPARKQDLLATFIQPKPASDVSQIAQHSLFAPPVALPSVPQSLKFQILFELNYYLSYSFKLHEGRVLELHQAIFNASTDVDIKKLIRQQSSLLLQGTNDELWERDDSFFYLNRAPGKATISIGYKRMLEKCMQHIATQQASQPTVTLTRSFADVD